LTLLPVSGGGQLLPRYVNARAREYFMKGPVTFGSLVSCFILALAPAASADVVSDWNLAALNAVRVERTSPPVAARALAILHISIFDAVNVIDRSCEPYLVRMTAPASASIDAAASAAAHKVLTALFPGQTASFDALHAAIVAGLGDSSHTRRGLDVGEAVAAQVLGARANDGAATVVSPPGGSGAGVWAPTPPGFLPYLLPQWGFVTPFALENAAAVRPPGPPPVESTMYSADFDEVKALGAATGSTRTPDESLIALFWADGAGTETPPGHWNTIARSVSEDLETPLVEKARLFALLNVALADAAIVAWDAKFTYNFWRPVTAIREGDVDGNDLTAGDPGWTSLIVTPPFPDYVSGHSTFSGAAATVLALFYRRDDIAFTATSDFLPGVTRVFARFSEAAGEAALSRLYGGIHFRSANEDGLRAGVDVGAWTFAHVMQLDRNRAR
jgi:hypothetical protein